MIIDSKSEILGLTDVLEVAFGTCEAVDHKFTVARSRGRESQFEGFTIGGGRDRILGWQEFTDGTFGATGLFLEMRTRTALEGRPCLKGREAGMTQLVA